MSHRTRMMSATRSLRSNLRVDWGVEGPWQWGTVQAISIGTPSTLSVYLDNSSGGVGATITPGIPFLESYLPVVGDIVLIARMAGPARTQRIVLGGLSVSGINKTEALIDEQLVSAVSSVVVPATGVLRTGFRNLKVRWKLRSAGNVAADSCRLQFNSSSTNNYVFELGQVDNGVFSGSETNSAPTSSIQVGAMAALNAPAGDFGAGEFTIFDYNSATDRKLVLGHSIDREGTSTSGMRYQATGGVWIISPVQAATSFTIFAALGTVSGIVSTYGC